MQKWVSSRLSTQICRGNWLGIQLRSGPTTILGDDENDDDDIDDDGDEDDDELFW